MTANYGEDLLVLVPVATWHVWESRNEEIFIQRNFDCFRLSHEISLYVGSALVAWSIGAIQTNIHRRTVQIAWKKLPLGWMKFNTDCAFRQGIVTGADVLRDELSAW